MISPQIKLVASVLLSVTGLSPAAKFLLIRAYWVYGFELCTETREQMARQVGMPLGQMGKAIKELASLGWCEVERQPGRPKKQLGLSGNVSFRMGVRLIRRRWILHIEEGEMRGINEALSEQVVDALSKALLWTPSDPSKGYWRRHLGNIGLRVDLDTKELLNTDKFQPLLPFELRKKPEFLHRLLLGILIVQADDFGIVWGASRGSLARLVGVPPSRIASLMKNLDSESFIRFKIPGVNGSILFPKLPSAYVLDSVMPVDHYVEQLPSTAKLDLVKLLSVKLDSGISKYLNSCRDELYILINKVSINYAKIAISNDMEFMYMVQQVCEEMKLFSEPMEKYAKLIFCKCGTYFLNNKFLLDKNQIDYNFLKKIHFYISHPNTLESSLSVFRASTYYFLGLQLANEIHRSLVDAFQSKSDGKFEPHKTSLFPSTKRSLGIFVFISLAYSPSKIYFVC